MREASRLGTAMVFPGMSPSRYADVGKFMLINPFARRLVAMADKRLGYSLVDRFREAEGDYSEYAQVAFMLNSLALAQWAEQALDIDADYCTGPSFGEKPASVYAGSLPFDEAVWMTAALARCLDEFFATEYQDVVTHSFVRTPELRLAEVLADLTDLGEWHDISCYVDDDFFMVSLRERNLDWLKRRIRGIGGLSLYTMRPPLHCRAFEALRRKAEDEVIGGLRFEAPLLPMIADQDGSVLRTGEEVRTMLLDSVTKPMRWVDVVRTLEQLSVGKVCVAGQDSLFGRVRCTTSRFEVIAASPRLALQPRRRGAGPTRIS
ncbi:[acyl-carrier-protein] S-malonyltransferase [Kibdelosporangium banguiense]|uniref:[acyl-carrier-protein] S-malonyltransferase n=1 Tax=Kibdelosporangium banguiense TaxID=1365924 RepID=A0ABS4TRS2_9PSEU|nr:ACP S-malonyltransferase [Kibdelosporangium banguiense]MBP2327108.1 [acyl-carrier-protein] S-malonyltransferase [Kibdelosporangium banguiense]